MNITPLQTKAILPNTTTLDEFIEMYIPPLHDHSIVAITSKVVSICERSVIQMETISKYDLIISESEYYLPPDNTYGLSLTIKHNTLTVNAGIDESNGHGYYILWPKDPIASAVHIRKYLMEKNSIQNLGVVITDSRSMPLRWGVYGTAISHAGFMGLRSYIGVKDIFGRPLIHTQANIAEGLAASAVLVMGEGGEQSPNAIIEDVPFVEFTDKPNIIDPIDIESDIYAPMLTKVEWKKGLSISPS
ncbi:coenzyme F420-0:L-glutamate ligase [Candidatus Woesebacteria bacterium]|nr:coenzyme F420-0:L-glutamate ligase [Candidatus Woesebacteria bacterium]